MANLKKRVSGMFDALGTDPRITKIIKHLQAMDLPADDPSKLSSDELQKIIGLCLITLDSMPHLIKPDNNAKSEQLKLLLSECLNHLDPKLQKKFGSKR